MSDISPEYHQKTEHDQTQNDAIVTEDFEVMFTYISKEKSPSDSRQYVLRLTKKGMEMIPTLIEINNQWEEDVGLNDLDDEFLEKLKTLAYNSIELNEKNQ